MSEKLVLADAAFRSSPQTQRRFFLSHQPLLLSMPGFSSSSCSSSCSSFSLDLDEQKLKTLEWMDIVAEGQDAIVKNHMPQFCQFGAEREYITWLNTGLLVLRAALNTSMNSLPAKYNIAEVGNLKVGDTEVVVPLVQHFLFSKNNLPLSHKTRIILAGSGT